MLPWNEWPLRLLMTFIFISLLMACLLELVQACCGYLRQHHVVNSFIGDRAQPHGELPPALLSRKYYPTLFMKPFLAQNISLAYCYVDYGLCLFLARSVSALVARRNPGDLGLEPFWSLHKGRKAHGSQLQRHFVPERWCDILAFPLPCLENS